MKNITNNGSDNKASKRTEDEKVYYDILSKPFKIYGVYYEDNQFVRLPEEVAKLTSPDVLGLRNNTAGGRVRFITNSSEIAIITQMKGSIGRMPHFTLCGAAGFDLYDKNVYVGTFMPPYHMEDGYSSALKFPYAGIHEVTIHFPLYSSVNSLKIGLDANSLLEPAPNYLTESPIVTYGSSITQGGCASRPGNCYQNIVSRKLNVDHINLGFSGSAKGELAMANYISSLEQSIFVLDYDANAPTIEHLASTHEPFFLKVREKNPNLPIIMMGRPNAYPSEEGKKRSAVILKTYMNALNRGDSLTYYIDMPQAIRTFCGNDGTVDNSHPNDLGFRCMAYAIISTIKSLKEILV